MSFPIESVVEHLQAQSDLLAECWEHAANREIAIDAEKIDLRPERPDFQAYGIATWMISGSTTLSVLIPTALLPTEWDGAAFAPPDLAERLVNAVLPETVDYSKSSLTTVGTVAGAFAAQTKTICIPVAEIKSPILVLVGLNNPDAVQRVGKLRLHDFPVQVIVTLAEKKVDMAQVLGLGVGTMITFEKAAEDFLDLYVNNHLHARGEAVKIGENFGLRINQLGVHDERVCPVIPPVRKVAAS